MALRTVTRSEHVAKFIRFPPELAEAVAVVAKRERRTFTAQLLLILDQWLQQQAPEQGRTHP